MQRPASLLVPPLLVAFFSLGCSDPEIYTRSASVHLSPEEIDLGIVFLRDRPDVEILVENRGSGSADLRFGDLPEGFTVKPSALQIGAFEKRTVTFHFRPAELGEVEAILTFQVEGKEGAIPVRARVFDSPLDGPDVINFGSVRMGTEAVEHLPLRNLLDEPILLSHRWGSGSSTVSYTIEAEGVYLEPDETVKLPIRFRPIVESGEQNATIYFGCDGCPSKKVSLLGKGSDVLLSFIPNPVTIEARPLEVVELGVDVTNAGEIFTGRLSLALENGSQFSVNPKTVGTLGPGEWTKIFITYEAKESFVTHRSDLEFRTEEGRVVATLPLAANVKGTELEVKGPEGVLKAPVGWQGGLPYAWRLEVINLGTQPEVPLTAELRGKDIDAFEIVPMDDGILEQGEAEPFRLHFRPQRLGMHEATVLFQGDGSQAAFSVRAWGNFPIAQCEEVGEEVQVAVPLELRGWDASELGDASCRWKVLEAPTGSHDKPSSDRDCGVVFKPQLVGEYLLEFELTDAAGNKDRCVQAFSALPFQHLWVELYWTKASDVDLYLLNHELGDSNSRSDWITDATCYFFNCRITKPSLPWGSMKEHRPLLDVDDVSGIGPENIQIEEIWPGSSFSVGVHWFNSKGHRSTEATVNVYCRGKREQSVSVTLDEPKLFYRLGEIDFEIGTEGCSVRFEPEPWRNFGHPP